MVHAAIIASALAAGVGSAIAFEVAIFRPWREEHWPEGIAAELRHEWDSFMRDFQQGVHDLRQPRSRNAQPAAAYTSGDPRRGPEIDEEEELRREIEAFELHEQRAQAQARGGGDRAQSSSAKTHLADTGFRRRNAKGQSDGKLVDLDSSASHGAFNPFASSPRQAFFDLDAPHHSLGSPTSTISDLPVVPDAPAVNEKDDSPPPVPPKPASYRSASVASLRSLSPGPLGSDHLDAQTPRSASPEHILRPRSAASSHAFSESLVSLSDHDIDLVSPPGSVWGEAHSWSGAVASAMLSPAAESNNPFDDASVISDAPESPRHSARVESPTERQHWSSDARSDSEESWAELTSSPPGSPEMLAAPADKACARAP